MEPANRALVVVALLLVLLVTKAGSIAVAIWVDSTWPAFAARIQRAYAKRARRCVIVGFVNGMTALLIALAFLNMKGLELLGLVLLGCLVCAAILGYGAAYFHLGRRLVTSPDLAPGWKLLLVGGLAAEAAFMAPVIGQAFSVGVFFRGIGAVLRACISREPAVDSPLAEDS